MNHDDRYRLGLAWPVHKKKRARTDSEKPNAVTPIRKPRTSSR